MFKPLFIMQQPVAVVYSFGHAAGFPCIRLAFGHRLPAVISARRGSAHSMVRHPAAFASNSRQRPTAWCVPRVMRNPGMAAAVPFGTSNPTAQQVMRQPRGNAAKPAGSSVIYLSCATGIRHHCNSSAFGHFRRFIATACRLS